MPFHSPEYRLGGNSYGIIVWTKNVLTLTRSASVLNGRIGQKSADLDIRCLKNVHGISISYVHNGPIRPNTVEYFGTQIDITANNFIKNNILL